MKRAAGAAMRAFRAGADTLALGVLAGILARESTSLGRIAGSVPRKVLFVTVVLIALQWMLDLRRQPSRGRESIAEPGGISGQPGSTVAAIAWVGSLVALVAALGTALGASVFCLAFLRGWARESWWVAFLYAVAVGVCLLAIFGGLLGARLLSGWLPLN